uniref:Secreted protein n=1 Tax=Amblyomma maculatum TaxID=34609 RepID=G3MKR3_AMBMU
MPIIKCLAAAVVMVLGVEAGLFRTQETPCSLPDIDLDDEIDQLLEKLPKDFIPIVWRGFQYFLPGLEIGNLNVTGMNKIKRYGPVVPYCMKAESMVQVDLVNMGEVALTVPWRICSGQEGTATLHAEYSRFTAHLVFDKEGSSGKYLAWTDRFPTLPVMTHNIEFVVKGLGKGGEIASFVMSKLITTGFQDLWKKGFFVNFRKAMLRALQENNEVI